MRTFLIFIGFLAVVGGVLSWVIRSGETGETSNTSAPVSISNSTPLLAAVMPHHDIVKKERRELLKQLASESQPETIILVSPNHFGGGKKPIMTTDYTWQLQGGMKHINSDGALIQNLLENENVENNEGVVRGDHGITNLLGDIHEFFPKAKIVPILLRDSIAPADVDRLEENVEEACGGICGVIASVDMSHYQSARAADIHDMKTIRALQMLNEESVWEAEVDSRASLAFLTRWARNFSLSHFNLFAHTNSGILAGNFEGETTTHIFGYYGSGAKVASNSEMTFTIVGGVSDCSSSHLKIDTLSDFGTRALWGADMSWAFWSLKTEHERAFRDRLMKVWHWTESSMQRSDESSIGESIRRSSVGNQQIVFVSADARDPFLESTLRRERVPERFLVALPRWSEEYSARHTESQRELSQSWVRAGADIIVGFHEGGLQDMETVDGVPVFYSVGKFIGGCGEADGLVMNGLVGPKSLELAFDPVQSNKVGVRLLSGMERKQALERLCISEESDCWDGYVKKVRNY